VVIPPLFGDARLWRAIRKVHVWRHNPLGSLYRWLSLAVLDRPITDHWPYERRVYTQHGEDGILDALFRAIGTTNRYYVEFGVGNGTERNTRFLAERRGWRGLLMDGGYENPAIGLHREFITADNILALFEKHGVPDEFDLLSIDIDGNDYWVWQRIGERCRPRVVVLEYNANAGPVDRRTIAYDPEFVWGGTDYYGASLAALADLGRSLGYVLAGCESLGVNAFFVRSDVAEGHVEGHSAREAFRPPRYGPSNRGHPPDPTRTMIEPDPA
jgi:hypothetical protein